jgi:hypothetical protein
MNRRHVLLSMSIFASLFGCGKKPPAKVAPVATNVFTIDHAHESGGAFYHGTISLIGDKAAAIWTDDEGGKKKSREIPMPEETFRTVWESMNDIADFKTGEVTDPDKRLDPKSCHVVGIGFSLNGKAGIRTFMIPAKTASPEFKHWLKKLWYPRD